MKASLRIAGPRRRKLLQAIKALLTARQLVDRAAAHAAAGGQLLPLGATRRTLSTLALDLHQQTLKKPKS